MYKLRMCDFKYCFMDLVVKWPGSVYGARIFQNSSLNKMLKDGTVLPCEKRIVPNRDLVPVICWEIQHTLFYHM